MLGGRTLGAAAVSVAVILAVGCGGSTKSDGSGGSAGSGGTAGSGGSAGAAGSGGTAGVAGSGGIAGSGGMAGAAGSGGTAGAGGSGGGALTASISQSQIYVDCMPIVGADPIGGSFDMLYDNQNGTQTANSTITSARFVMKQGQNTLTWSFSVSPAGSGPVVFGNTKTVTHTKIAGSGSGQGAQTPCSYCGGTGTLQVTWQSNGKSFSDSTQPQNILCAL